jgi:hypothetical protein
MTLAPQLKFSSVIDFNGEDTDKIGKITCNFSRVTVSSAKARRRS